jgi:hypothetical protein
MSARVANPDSVALAPLGSEVGALDMSRVRGYRKHWQLRAIRVDDLDLDNTPRVGERGCAEQSAN